LYVEYNIVLYELYNMLQFPQPDRESEEDAMPRGRDRTVYQRHDGLWVNKRNDADRASSLHETQRDANETAREMLENQGGGELTTMGRNHLMVSKDTIPPAHDPNPPRDTEH
jgi:hypothetical protein